MANRNVEVMNSSNVSDWATPQEFVDGLPFDFTLDACSTLESAKCAEYISPKMDALREDRRWPGVVWLNPPYDNVKAFLEKAYAESLLGSTVVCLVPARPETGWFHNIWKYASLICFVGRRIKFTMPDTPTGGKTAGAPFANVVAVFGEMPMPTAIDNGYVDEWYARELSRIGTVILPGHEAIYLHGEKG